MKNLVLKFLILSFLTSFGSISFVNSDLYEETLIKFNGKSTEVFTTTNELDYNEM
ncbi:hypothetical protein [Clostridium senegalense]|uniref:hypothetical protein n=1 Tax=Clostridium senegalense TaxID=1465809 RepID=UPI001C11E237|nr:hypothetical protein [Clostridium senegalense]MBU5226849.1 hypothetical protein [Clostridium senegalense]